MSLTKTQTIPKAATILTKMESTTKVRNQGSVLVGSGHRVFLLKIPFLEFLQELHLLLPWANSREVAVV